LNATHTLITFSTSIRTVRTCIERYTHTYYLQYKHTYSTYSTCIVSQTTCQLWQAGVSTSTY